MTRLGQGLFLLVLVVRSALGAEPEHLGVTAGVSRDSYMISSTFTGTEIVVFGGIEAAQGGVLASREGIDVAVVVFGPEQHVTVRRKERVAGLWINRTAERFERMLAYYYAAATADIATLAPPDVLASRGVGLDGMLKPVRAAAEPFRDAIVRRKQADLLYVEKPGGVTFLSSSVFRATIPLPAQVPVGDYTIKVFAFKNGQLAGGTSVPFAIDKEGIERWTYELATKRAWAYAALSVLGALLAGWVAYIAFRERH
ncbi:MAG TPA: hypothetical protein DCL54_12600 [Alphaproteobacteria bacterium]|nr:hypothetical protein [Alphaproteobacteria bacterium]HAJ47409.1 hypothetical protein [Alphaproteobacteria bacterium]